MFRQFSQSLKLHGYNVILINVASHNVFRYFENLRLKNIIQTKKGQSILIAFCTLKKSFICTLRLRICLLTQSKTMDNFYFF